MITRRFILGSLSSAVAAFAVRHPAHGAPITEGCQLRSSLSDPGLGVRGVAALDATTAPAIKTSGDKDLDRFLGRALVRLANQFEVYPGFAFFNDSTALNALASPHSHPDLASPETKGTVLFGINLFQRTLSATDDQGMAILSVCAHEFGHIHQYNSGVHTELTELSKKITPAFPVKLIELHADYLAGYYLALRKMENPQLKLWAAGALINHLGDTNFNSPSHHGTSAQRVSAIEEGFRFGTTTKQGIQAASASGVEFVVKMFS